MAKKEVKLSKEQVKELAGVGIKGVNTVEEARKKMIEFLNENDIEDVDDDSYEDLFEMVDAMYEDSEQANDDLADEVEDEDSEDEDEDSDDEDEEEDEEEDDEDEDEDEEDEEPAPKKKSSSKKNVEVEKKNDKVQKSADKKAKKETTKKEKAKAEPKVSKRLNPLQSEEDAKKFDALKKALGKDFEYNFIANGGVSVKFLGKNNKKVFMSFDSPKVTKDGEIIGRVYMSSVRDENVLRDLFGEDFEIKKSWSGNMLVMGISLDELVECIKENKDGFDEVVANLSKKDEKLGKNREKMEKDLKSSNAKKAEKVKSSKKEEAPAAPVKKKAKK